MPAACHNPEIQFITRHIIKFHKTDSQESGNPQVAPQTQQPKNEQATQQTRSQFHWKSLFSQG